jgi:hypothetical protein
MDLMEDASDAVVGALHGNAHANAAHVMMAPKDALKALIGAINDGYEQEVQKIIDEQDVDINGHFTTYRSAHQVERYPYTLRYLGDLDYQRNAHSIISATALDAVVCTGRVDIVRLLLNAGALVTADRFLWKDALSNRSTTTIFKLLFARFAAINAPMSTDNLWKKLDIMGWNKPFLSVAAAIGTPSMLQCVVDLGAEVIRQGHLQDTAPLEELIRSWDKGHPMHYNPNLQADNVEKCRILIENGAAYESIGSAGKINLLSVAVRMDTTSTGELVRMLLATDMKRLVNFRDPGTNLFGEHELTRTPLTTLIVKNHMNHMNVMEQLHRAGACLTKTSSNRSPLSIAVGFDRKRAVAFIVENMTTEQVRSMGRVRSEIPTCLQRRDFETAVVLIKAGMECESVDSVTGMTPIYSMVLERVNKRGRKDKVAVSNVIDALLCRDVCMTTQCYPLGRRPGTTVQELLYDNSDVCRLSLGVLLDKRVRAAIALQMEERNLALGGINNAKVGMNSPGRIMSDDLVKLIASINDRSIHM